MALNIKYRNIKYNIVILFWAQPYDKAARERFIVNNSWENGKDYILSWEQSVAQSHFQVLPLPVIIKCLFAPNKSKG